jgi:hypothetical protein
MVKHRDLMQRFDSNRLAEFSFDAVSNTGPKTTKSAPRWAAVASSNV